MSKPQKEKGYHKITIGGGDPLSRPDIIALLESIKKLGFQINLDTVGTPLLGNTNAKFYGTQLVHQVSAKVLAGIVDNIGIPLDGSNQEIASAFRRGRETLFADQLRIIQLLGDAGAKICLNTVVSKLNQADLPKLLKCISILPIQKWQLFQFMPIGLLGSRNREKLEISEENFRQAIAEVREFTKDLKPDLLIEAKSVTDRKNRYLLVNDAGIAWIPTGNGEERIELGNIAKNRGQEVFNLIERHDNNPKIALSQLNSEQKSHPIEINPYSP